MALLTPTSLAQLIANCETQKPARGTPAEIDFRPVVKLFTPDAGATWLLTELDPDDHDLAFGLCDLGLGYPEVGRVRISELEVLRGRLGLPVERDLHFQAAATLRDYATEASQAVAELDLVDTPRRGAVAVLSIEGGRLQISASAGAGDATCSLPFNLLRGEARIPTHKGRFVVPLEDLRRAACAIDCESVVVSAALSLGSRRKRLMVSGAVRDRPAYFVLTSS